jgi:hypothetical protein
VTIDGSSAALTACSLGRFVRLILFVSSVTFCSDAATAGLPGYSNNFGKSAAADKNSRPVFPANRNP